MKRQIEPTFLGARCTGENPKMIEHLKEHIKALNLLIDFYNLDRNSQLVMAAVVTEMMTDRSN